jgi:two-component system sensor histidine kinase SenX3
MCGWAPAALRIVGGVDALLTALTLACLALTVAVAALWRRERRFRASVRDAVEGIIGEVPGRAEPDALRKAVEKLSSQLDEVEIMQSRQVAALHGAEVGILVADSEGRAVFANSAAERYLGARHGDAVAEIRLREMIETAARTGVPASQDLELYTPVRRVLGLRALPLSRSEDASGVVVYVQDLSAQRSVDVMRRDFVANASHELKTPLGGLSVLAEAIGAAGDDETRAGLTGRMRSELRRMTRLIDDILKLSQLESGVTNAAPTAVVEILDEAHRRVSAAADGLGVSVVVKPPSPSVTVVGDREMLVSAVANLLDNAIKYTGTPAGAGGAVWVSAETDDDDVSIVVEDQGIGIPAAHLDRVFERFYRVDRARSRETGGTGLGLSIVRHVAIGHGGSVSVESELGRGSTFTLRLPHRTAGA